MEEEKKGQSADMPKSGTDAQGGSDASGARVTVHRWIVGILSVIGAGFMYYLAGLKAGESAVCDLSAGLSCSAVNTSTFSEIAGIPLSYLGIAYFATLILLMLLKGIERRFEYAAAFSVFSVVFGLYLSGVEALIIGSFCLFCELSKVIMLAVIGVSLHAMKRVGQRLDTNLAVIAVIAGLLMSGASFLLSRTPPIADGLDYTAQAQCITEAGYVMYGAFGCSHCKRQKELFGDAAQYIAYVECDARGENAEAERCIEKNILNTPTWVLEPDGPDGEELERMEGVFDVADLAERAGCEI